MEEDDLRGGVVEDVRDLVRREPDVDRVEDGARLDDAVVGLEQVVGVEGDERHPVAGLDAELDERVGQPVRPIAECAVGELLVPVDDTDLVTEERRRAVAELEDGQRHEHAATIARPTTGRSPAGCAIIGGWS